MQLMNMSKTERICILLVRLLAVGATIAAAVIMGTSNQTASIFTITFEAKYSHTPAFRYFLAANIIAGVYSFLVLLLPSDQSLLWRLVVALDLVMTMLLTSSISAAMAIAYVGKNGNSNAGWLPICAPVENYCHKVGVALIAGFVGVLLYMILIFYSLRSVLYPDMYHPH